MKKEEIYELMDRFESGSLYSMEFSCEDFTLKLKKFAAPADAAPAAGAAVSRTASADAGAAGGNPEEADASEYIVSPLAGTFYTSPEPGAEPYVTPGSSVKAGQTLCLVEAMKTMNEITAPCDCLIQAVLAEDAAVVSYGEALIRYTKA